MGFLHVYRYKPAKMDWLANGLPFEGEESGEQRAGDLAQMDVPTCRAASTIADAKSLALQKGTDLCVVVDGSEVVLGLLDPDALQSDENQTVEQVMNAGVQTFRLNRKLDSALEAMNKSNLDYALVTNVDGRLFGLIRREDLEKALKG